MIVVIAAQSQRPFIPGPNTENTASCVLLFRLSLLFFQLAIEGLKKHASFLFFRAHFIFIVDTPLDAGRAVADDAPATITVLLIPWARASTATRC